MKDAEVATVKGQAQILRGIGFSRTSLHELEKSMERAVAQVHSYNRLGSQFEVDRMKAFRKARNGDYDKQAMALNGPVLANTSH